MKVYIRQDIKPYELYTLDGRTDSYMEEMNGEADKLYEAVPLEDTVNWYSVYVNTSKSKLTYNYHISWLILPEEMKCLTIPEPLVMAMF